jgi:hypothetical protein
MLPTLLLLLLLLLLQGIDCPMNAAFMDADIFYSGMSGPTTYKNAICVFEHSPSECTLYRTVRPVCISVGH